MNVENDEKKQDNEPVRREAYESPRIEESAGFETLALTCGLLSGLTCATMGGPSAS